MQTCVREHQQDSPDKSSNCNNNHRKDTKKYKSQHKWLMQKYPNKKLAL